MLTIENYKRLKGKVIGQTGYYVQTINPVVMTDIKAPYESTHWYLIEITNRKQVIMVQLDRIGFLTGTEFILYELKLGQTYITINRYELMDMNIVVDKINKLILEQYVS